jgi:hypothetical protein
MKNITKSYFAILVTMLFTQFGFGQIIENDEIGNAIEINSFPHIAIEVHTDNATPIFVSTPIGCDYSVLDKLAYYKFQAQSSFDLTVELLDGTSGSFVGIFQASSLDVQSDSELLFVSSQFCGNQSITTAPIVVNNFYYVVVYNPNNSTDIFFYDESDSAIVNIPDANLKNALLNTDCVSNDDFTIEDFESAAKFISVSLFTPKTDLDFNNDGEIQIYEARSVEQLSIDSNNISDLTGLEEFTNLKELFMRTNNVSDLTPLLNLDLEILNCSENPIINLDLSSFPNLKAIRSGSNDLQSINLTQNTNLLSIAIVESNENANPNNFDISNNNALLSLFLGNLPAQNIDFSNKLNLINLVVIETELNTIDLSQNNNIENLHLDNNSLSQIDLTQNTLLEGLIIRNNDISQIDLSQNILLDILEIVGCELTQIDLSQNQLLRDIDLSLNNLTQLDLTQNTELRFLEVAVNELTDIDVSQSPDLEFMNVRFNNLYDLDITQNLALELLSCRSNQLTSLDTSSNSQLFTLDCRQNNITAFDFSNNGILSYVICGSNEFTSLDFSQNLNLLYLECSNSLLTDLDLSQNANLNFVFLYNNNFLEHVNLKNGNNTQINNLNTINSTNLQTICVDDVSYAITNFQNVEPQTIFVNDCLNNTVNYNLIDGLITFDDDTDGCDAGDFGIPNVMVTVNDGNNEFSTFTQNDGSYLFDVVSGSFSITPGLESYMTPTPASANSIFNDFGLADTHDFCVNSNQIYNDIEVSLLAIDEARPGFDSNYQLVYKNIGTETIQNGTITLEFDNSMQQFVSASPVQSALTSNTITFDYANLSPFQSETIDLVLNTFQPPTVQSDDVLNFTASIEPASGDNDTENNTYNLEQIVVNSFDPNDITVLQGEAIFAEEVDNDLDYVIRFQNTGTASAINVIITHDLDNDLNWDSFMPVSSSHDYRIEITNGDFVEFIFENINLPDIISDEENSQGFVAFKIKPKSDAVVGDTFTGFADIYFDFNAPIRTNTAFTEIVENLSTPSFNTLDFRIFPNPTEGLLNIQSNSTIDSIEVSDIRGRKLLTKRFSKTDVEIDLSALENGIYFIKIQSGNSTETKKIIKD